MNKKCLGCGAVFQTTNPLEPGFVDEKVKEKALVCKRCFRIKNYGDYQVIKKRHKRLSRNF